MIRINPGGNGESQVPKSLGVKKGWGIFFYKVEVGLKKILKKMLRKMLKKMLHLRPRFLKRIRN